MISINGVVTYGSQFCESDVDFLVAEMDDIRDIINSKFLDCRKQLSNLNALYVEAESSFEIVEIKYKKIRGPGNYDDLLNSCDIKQFQRILSGRETLDKKLADLISVCDELEKVALVYCNVVKDGLEAGCFEKIFLEYAENKVDKINNNATKYRELKIFNAKVLCKMQEKFNSRFQKNKSEENDNLKYHCGIGNIIA